MRCVDSSHLSHKTKKFQTQNFYFHKPQFSPTKKSTPRVYSLAEIYTDHITSFTQTNRQEKYLKLYASESYEQIISLIPLH